MLTSTQSRAGEAPSVVSAPVQPTIFSKTTTSFETFSGEWTLAQAAHLLRRTTFGPTHAQLKWAQQQGLAATLDSLFEDIPLPSPPLNYGDPDDSHVDVGDSWVNAPYSQNRLVEEMANRWRSLQGWAIGLMREEGVHIREKLTLFWHNHFPVNSILDPKFCYRYTHLLRTHCWGNFRDLVKEMTRDPAMLIHLNGNKNKEESPNENYGRELLELFSIGKGPLAGPGDYTHYTEDDVREAARILTGWRDFGFTTHDASGDIGSYFDASRHDTGTKTLSHRFNHALIQNEGAEEYAQLIDIIFAQQEVARFICRRLYTWFLFYDISPETEANVIEPMAQLLIDNDYQIQPALRAFLASEHFYEAQFKGAMIKHPYDFAMSLYKPLDIKSSQLLDEKYDSWYRVFGFTSLMQMTYWSIPEVAGWSAFYREPLYYRNWINATTLPVRVDFAETLLQDGLFPFQANGPQMRIDPLAFIEQIDNPSDPNAVVEEFARILFPKPLTADKHAQLKSVLISGLPDFEWTVEYSDYLSQPDNPSVALPVRNKLRDLLQSMLRMSEFQLH